MIHQLTIKRLIQSQDIISLEQDLALADSLNKIPFINSSIHTDILTVFFCIKGQMQIIVGDSEYHISAGDAFLCKPGETIQQVLTSSDCKTWTLFYTPHIANHMLPVKNDLAMLLEGGFERVIHFGKDYMSERIFLLLDTLRNRSIDKQLPFHSQIVFHLYFVLLFEVLNRCCPIKKTASAVSADMSVEKKHASRSDTLFQQFIQLLNEDGGRHRTVAFYAEQLCVTPKHLSRVIREKSHEGALNIINSFAVQQIKIDLKLTDLPINALATKYNFGNFSFFCQFVKKHLGMKPQEYREK